MLKFIDRFMQEEMLNDGKISTFISLIWTKYDTDGSGALDKMETLKFLNEFLEMKEKPPTTLENFERFFKKFDANGDEEIGKDEMLKFIEGFMQQELLSDGKISTFVEIVWSKYDTDGSGALDKMETLKFLNEFLELKEKPAISFEQFNKFFLKFDENGDEEIGKEEMMKFIEGFLHEEMLQEG